MGLTGTTTLNQNGSGSNGDEGEMPPSPDAV